MNCCGDHKNDETKKSHHPAKSHMSHMWMMLLCCGAPLIVLGIISLLGTGFPAIRGVLTSILPFLCPVLMIAMIPMMLRHGKHEEDSKDEKPNVTTEEKS